MKTICRKIWRAGAYCVGILGALVVIGSLGSCELGEISGGAMLLRCLIGAAMIGGGMMICGIIRRCENAAGRREVTRWTR